MRQNAWVAFGLAEDRARNADRERFARAASGGQPSLPRRALARLFVLNSRASEGIARRLDADISRRFDAAGK